MTVVVKDQSMSFPLRRISVYKQTGSADSNSFPSQILTMTRTRSGESNPKWKEKIARGENATTGLTAWWDQYFGDKGYIYWHANHKTIPGTERSSLNNGDLFPGFISVPFATLTLPVTDADNGARTKFYKKLRSWTVQVSGPTFIGELRETVRMIKKPAAAFHEGLERYCDAVRRQAPKKPRTSRSDTSKKAKSEWREYSKTLAQTAGGLWLERAFGWLPLIHDIEDGFEAYERLDQPRYSKRISASFVDSKDTTKNLSSFWNGASTGYPNSFSYVFGKAIQSESVIAKYRGAVISQAEGLAPVDQLALFGFTPTEILPTAWELLPWSFLIDYFANIGDLISASVTDTSKVSWVNQTFVQQSTFSGRLEMDWLRTEAFHSAYKFDVKESSPGYTVISRKKVSRQPGLSIAMPNLQFTLPGVGQQFNMAALISQMSFLHPQNISSNRFKGRNYRL